jgi:hypothetical protein
MPFRRGSSDSKSVAVFNQSNQMKSGSPKKTVKLYPLLCIHITHSAWYHYFDSNFSGFFWIFNQFLMCILSTFHQELKLAKHTSVRVISKFRNVISQIREPFPNSGMFPNSGTHTFSEFWTWNTNWHIKINYQELFYLTDRGLSYTKDELDFIFNYATDRWRTTTVIYC